MSLFKEGMSQVTEESIKEAESNTVPAGDYNIQCEESEIRTNDRTGTKSVSMKFKILGPTCAGRVFFQNFYCFSENDQHNKRQFDRMGSFAKAAGIPGDGIASMDIDDFKGLKAACRLKIQKDQTGQYDDKNEISHFKKWIDEMEQAAQAEASQEEVPL